MQKPVVVCSLGDASVTEGEVSEALQFTLIASVTHYLFGAG